MKDADVSEHGMEGLKVYTKMMRAVAAVTDRMHGHLGEEGITVSQFGVLEALFHLGPLCQRDIGDKILKTSGNITVVIDNLERRGLVVREKDPDDRRRMIVSLTEAGFSLIRRIFPRHARIAESVFLVLESEELEKLGMLLEKLGKSNM